MGRASWPCAPSGAARIQATASATIPESGFVMPRTLEALVQRGQLRPLGGLRLPQARGGAHGANRPRHGAGKGDAVVRLRGQLVALDRGIRAEAVQRPEDPVRGVVVLRVALDLVPKLGIGDHLAAGRGQRERLGHHRETPEGAARAPTGACSKLTETVLPWAEGPLRGRLDPETGLVADDLLVRAVPSG